MPLYVHTRDMIERALGSVCFLAKLEEVKFVDGREKGWAAQFDPDFELYVDLGQYIDLDEERARLDKEIARAQKDIAAAEKQLANENFVSKAPAEKVEGVRTRLSDAQQRLQKLQSTRSEL
mgnify:FL=1